jgi:hypothetical protein
VPGALRVAAARFSHQRMIAETFQLELSSREQTSSSTVERMEG